jgi:DNA-binding response OmpR family regulator
MAHTEKRKILCIDDNDTCEMLKALLATIKMFYCEVSSASSAREARELIGKDIFDLYILDYRFSDGNGPELCRFIRTRDSHVPVIFLTAIATEQYRLEALSAGATLYLLKPYDLHILTTKVEQLLKNRGYTEQLTVTGRA